MRLALIMTAVLGTLVAGLSFVGCNRVKSAQVDAAAELQHQAQLEQRISDEVVKNYQRRIGWLGNLWVPVGLLGATSAVVALLGLMTRFLQQSPTQPKAEP